MSDVIDRLRGLPEFDPPAGLWLAIERTRRRSARRRYAGGLAIAASVAVAIALVLRAGAPFEESTPRRIAAEDAGRGPTDDAVERAIARSRALEIDLAGLSDRAAAIPAVALESDLARVDAALQRAYDRAAAPDELAALWSRRAALLEALVAARSHPHALRI